MGTTTKSRATICGRPEETVILIWIRWLLLRMRVTYVASILDSHLECTERNQISLTFHHGELMQNKTLEQKRFKKKKNRFNFGSIPLALPSLIFGYQLLFQVAWQLASPYRKDTRSHRAAQPPPPHLWPFCNGETPTSIDKTQSR